MSQPENKQTPPNQRTDVEPLGPLARISRQSAINTERVDPHRDEPLACILGGVILGRSTADEKDLVGKLFTHILETATPEHARQFFARVLELKKSAAMPAHRNAFAYYAYSNYIEETGREPSKAELRKYIMARREIYKDAPGPEDGRGWTRVWKAVGLSDLRQG